MATDVMLVATQEWLKNTYGDRIDVPTDGTGRAKTVKGLIKALQIELDTTADGVWGVTTSFNFNTLFQEGLSANIELEDSDKLKRIVYILQGGFYTVRAISPGGLDGEFGDTLTSAVKEFQSQVGVQETGIIWAYLMKAILTTDVYTKDDNYGDDSIVTIQKQLNKKYCNILGIIPTNGVYSKATNKGLIAALQYELGLPADGIWGTQTMSALPTLQRYGNISNKQIVYILQYALYINGFDPNGFDGGFGAGVQSAVKKFQSFVGLSSDGVCGKQTWASLLVSYGDKNRTATACDCVSEITSARAQTLKKAGYTTVGRYLTNVGPMTLNKKIQEGEIETIINAGLTIFPIYQTVGNYANYFNRGRGLSDAVYAYKAAKSYGFKEGTIIYFGVDFDALGTDINEKIIPYFEGIKEKMSELNNYYKIGVYGPRGVCSKTKEKGLTVSSFVGDMSSGFSANIGNILPRDWAFDQIATIKLGSGDGEIEIDKDITNTIGSSEFDAPEIVYNDADDELLKDEQKNNLKTEIVKWIKETLEPYQNFKSVREPEEAAELLMEYDSLITMESKELKVRKALIQTVFMWECSCEGADDVVADGLVYEYYEYMKELEKWNNLSEEEKQNTAKPEEPLVKKNDSSTGDFQIFAKTAMDAYNYAIDRGIIRRKKYDLSDWKQVYTVWLNLKNSKAFASESAALVLLRAADLVNVSEITYRYSDDDVKKVLARYNGTNNDATEYGKRNFGLYQIFEKYNKSIRGE